MTPTPLPETPLQKVTTDLFYHNGKTYIIVVYYYSRFFELAPLKSTTTENAINHLRQFFCRHDIPAITVSDKGPQFAAATFSKFAEEWGFTHLTSNPQYPQSNGEVERAVKTAKDLIIKSEDPYLALLSYRSTPLQNGYTPAELLMGRKLRKLPNLEQLQKTKRAYKLRLAENYNKRHRTSVLPESYPGDKVWILSFHLPDSICKLGLALGSLICFSSFICLAWQWHEIIFDSPDFLFQAAELRPYNIAMFLSRKRDVRLLINLSHA